MTTTQSRTPIQAARIRMAAAQLGWNASELHRQVEDELDISYASVRDILNGSRRDEVPPSWLQVFAQKLGQDYLWLSGFEGSLRELTPSEIVELGGRMGDYVSLFAQPVPALAA